MVDHTKLLIRLKERYDKVKAQLDSTPAEDKETITRLVNTLAYLAYQIAALRGY